MTQHWFGNTNSEWQVVPLREFAVLGTGHTPSREKDEYWESCTIPWVTIEDLRENGVDSFNPLTDTCQKISELGLKNSAAVLHPKGTVMLSRTASIGFSCVIGREMATTQAFVTWTPDQGRLDSDYLHAALKVMRDHFFAIAYGATHLTIYFPDIKSLKIPLPMLSEQRRIVGFIKYQTQKIDTLIEKQKQLIQLLKEKRQAVISHAVTKGLSSLNGGPSAKMRDSGVEWLGEVPEHWKVMRIGWFCEFISYGFTNPMPSTDDGPYMLTATDIEFGRVKYEEARRTSEVAFNTLLSGKSKPIQGDILLTKDGTLGRVTVFDGAHDVCISQSVALLRLKRDVVLPDFVSMALMGADYQRKMIFDAGGTTIKHIYISILAKMNFLVPEVPEQIEILAGLNERLKKIDHLIGQAELASDLFFERRTALISAAVTGKIDVRNWFAPPASPTHKEVAA
jgi:type I restriction enzyme S subunit